MEAITLEYTYLLTSQLESQRLFFEEKLAAFDERAKEQVVFRLISHQFQKYAHEGIVIVRI